MKIGFDAKRYYHNNTGLGNYSRTLVASLQNLFPENEYALYDSKSVERTLRLGRRAASEGCDIFHGLSNELPFDVKRTSMKSIVTIHDVAWRTFPDMYHFLDRQIYDVKYGWAAKNADVVICISESTRNDVMRFYGVPEERTRIVYQPVGSLFYSPISMEEAEKRIAECEALKGIPQEFILSVGSINSRKNLLAIVKAVELLPRDQRIPLVVIGNGREYKREVENYIGRHALSDYVHICGNVNEMQTLQALYKKAKAFVYPSFYEGFGLPVVEAALQGTPVITSTVSSLPEAAGPDACLINPHDNDASEQIAHFIDRFCSDTEYARISTERSEGYARRMFDPETLTKIMMDVYREL